MKPSHLFLSATLTLNLVLGGALWLKAHPHFFESALPPASTPVSAPDPLLAALVSGDAAALRSAGAPDEVVRHLALGRALARLQARLRAVQPTPPADPRYWRNAAYLRNPYTREQRAEIAAAQREFADALRGVLGEDVSIDPVRDPRRAFLPAEKQDQLSRIERDYDEMAAEIRRDVGGLQLPSDREKLRYLHDEKDRDIAALLTPAERDLLELRESPTAQFVRARFGDVIDNEADFRKVFALQKAFDEEYPDAFSPNRTTSPSEAGRARREAEPQLAEEIRAALGDEKFDAFLRAADQDRRALASLERRLDLPAGSTDRTLAIRDSYADESKRINDDPGLNESDRKARVQQLATRARQDLATTLGPVAAEAYAPAATWLLYLAQGSAFTARPHDDPSMSRLMPFISASVPLPLPRPPAPLSK
jgi:hypothetical protein